MFFLMKYMAIMITAAPAINAPETKYGPRLVLSHPGRQVVANNQEVMVWMANATGSTVIPIILFAFSSKAICLG